MKLTELYDNRVESNGIEFDFNMADFSNNSDELTYSVNNLPVNGRVVTNAGTLTLHVPPEDLAREILESTDDSVESVDGIRFNGLDGNFNYSSGMSGNSMDLDSSYTLTVNYTTTTGERGTTQLTYDNSTFTPSRELSSSLT